MKYFLFIAILCFHANHIFAQSPQTVMVRGYLQTWMKECDQRNLSCGLPQPRSPKHFIEVTLVESVQPGTISQKTVVKKMGEFTVHMSFYWVSRHSRPGVETGYISIQTRLLRFGGLMSEFGQYRADTDKVIFPVGYLATPIQNRMQSGVSFSLK